MNPEISPGLAGAFLDDFYTECDEHLTAIRDALVTLESSIGRAQPDPTVVEKLFRSFHSFKGNSAIVGLRPAEELAHAAEDFLRELSHNEVTLTREGLDLLIGTMQRLEQVAASHRENKL
jgi:two-component system chemotaxis sensor kinase CheA